MHDVDWFLERLEIAQWNSSTPGQRDAHANCPCCGGHDPLHLTEKNGRALVTCFSCGAGYVQVVKALDAGDAEEPDPEPAPASVSTDTSPAVTDMSPLDWYAGYCGVGRATIEALGVEETADGWVRHTWPGSGVAKDRRPNSADRRWVPKGASPPRLWPQIAEPFPEEIWLCEGETDAIVLRLAYGLDAYTSGSVTGLLTAEEMRSLRRHGVERVVVAYDNDKEGRKASRAVVEAAREARLGAAVAHLGDPFLGGPKDWRERWTSGDASVPTTGSLEELDEIRSLAEVEAATDTALLLGRMHPTAHTILFGDGKTGKGVIAAQWSALLTRPENGAMSVLVLDYEQNAQHEWRPRVERFGCGHTPPHTPPCPGALATLGRVFIWQPSEPIWDIAESVRQAVVELRIGLVVVDSVVYACGREDVDKSGTAATYSLAVARFGCPVLSLAHTTKAELNPQHPFGSVFWNNGARMAICVARGEDQDSPRQVRCKSVNQGAAFPPYQISWEWVNSDLPACLEESPLRSTYRDRVYAALAVLGGHGTKEKIVARMSVDGEGDFVLQTVSNDLGNEKRYGRLELRGREWWLPGPLPKTGDTT